MLVVEAACKNEQGKPLVPSMVEQIAQDHTMTGKLVIHKSAQVCFAIVIEHNS